MGILADRIVVIRSTVNILEELGFMPLSQTRKIIIGNDYRGERILRPFSLAGG